jgi:hypothetical protein
VQNNSAGVAVRIASACFYKQPAMEQQKILEGNVGWNVNLQRLEKWANKLRHVASQCSMNALNFAADTLSAVPSS